MITIYRRMATANRYIKHIFLTFFLLFPPSLQACELALALTVDVSGSVDQAEYELQMRGLANALTDQAVSRSIIEKRANILVIQWTGNNRQAIVLPWTEISDEKVLSEVVEKMQNTPRQWRHFSTAIGAALVFTANQFTEVPHCKRKVIDVSGDGYSNEGPSPEDIGDALSHAGFTINGLAIEGSEENLTGYYREHVIAGNGAFVMTAQNFDDYPDRIRRKLLREVTEKIVLLE